MSSSCSQLKAEFLECMRDAPCMSEDRRSFHECLRSMGGGEGARNERIPDYCYQLRHSYFRCKRGQVRRRVAAVVRGWWGAVVGRGGGVTTAFIS